MPIIGGDDGNVVQRRHMIPPLLRQRSRRAYPRFAVSFSFARLFSFVSPLVSTTSSLFVKRVAIAPMPRDIADASFAYNSAAGHETHARSPPPAEQPRARGVFQSPESPLGRECRPAILRVIPRSGGHAS